MYTVFGPLIFPPFFLCFQKLQVVPSEMGKVVELCYYEFP